MNNSGRLSLCFRKNNIHKILGSGDDGDLLEVVNYHRGRNNWEREEERNSTSVDLPFFPQIQPSSFPVKGYGRRIRIVAFLVWSLSLRRTGRGEWIFLSIENAKDLVMIPTNFVEYIGSGDGKGMIRVSSHLMLYFFFLLTLFIHLFIQFNSPTIHLRHDIPNDCPFLQRELVSQCWQVDPTFEEIIQKREICQDNLV